MTTYKQIYRSNKKNYRHLSAMHHISLFGGNMTGGGNDNDNYESIIKEIDRLADDEIKNLKVIEINALCGLQMRVYERDGDKIQEIQFIPPNVLKYINTLDSLDYLVYYEKKHGNILKNNLSNVELNFDTNKKIIKVAFHSNYVDGAMSGHPIGNKTTFNINLPIKLVDFIEQLFDHFDKVGLIGYPDNGGIDYIKYDPKDDVYLVQTWS